MACSQQLCDVCADHGPEGPCSSPKSAETAQRDLLGIAKDVVTELVEDDHVWQSADGEKVVEDSAYAVVVKHLERVLGTPSADDAFLTRYCWEYVGEGLWRTRGSSSDGIPTKDALDITRKILEVATP